MRAAGPHLQCEYKEDSFSVVRETRTRNIRREIFPQHFKGPTSEASGNGIRPLTEHLR